MEVDDGDRRALWRDVPKPGEGSPGVGGDAGDDVALGGQFNSISTHFSADFSTEFLCINTPQIVYKVTGYKVAL